MNENVKKVLEKNLWYLATCGDEPNVVPVGFKHITEDDKLVVGAVLLEATLENIQKSGGKIAIAACDPKTMEAYQIKGTAEFVTEGPLVDPYIKLAEQMFKGALTAKGALVITPEKVIVATPNQDNKKEL